MRFTYPNNNTELVLNCLGLEKPRNSFGQKLGYIIPKIKGKEPEQVTKLFTKKCEEAKSAPGKKLTVEATTYTLD